MNNGIANCGRRLVDARRLGGRRLRQIRHLGPLAAWILPTIYLEIATLGVGEAPMTPRTSKNEGVDAEGWHLG